MEKYEFNSNRKSARQCPCGKDNKGGRFAPFKNFETSGYCHKCGKTFLPNSKTVETPIYKHFVPIEPSFHDIELVEKSLRKSLNNNFITFLKTKFNNSEVEKAILKYIIGTSPLWNGATVFWQKDDKGKIRHGKIMLYNAETGKRKKNAEGQSYISSIRSYLKLDNFQIKQCLFGLHLINENNEKKIALVESDKTAIIMSIFMPEYTWLSTGNKQNFKYDMLKPIKDYIIVAFPDKSEYEDWYNKALDLNKFGFKIVVNDSLENSEYPDGTDLADVYLCL